MSLLIWSHKLFFFLFTRNKLLKERTCVKVLWPREEGGRQEESGSLGEKSLLEGCPPVLRHVGEEEGGRGLSARVCQAEPQGATESRRALLTLEKIQRRNRP